MGSTPQLQNLFDAVLEILFCIHIIHNIYVPFSFYNLPFPPPYRPLSTMSENYTGDVLLWAESTHGEAVWGEGVDVWACVWAGADLWHTQL